MCTGRPGAAGSVPGDPDPLPPPAAVPDPAVPEPGVPEPAGPEPAGPELAAPELVPESGVSGPGSAGPSGSDLRYGHGRDRRGGEPAEPLPAEPLRGGLAAGVSRRLVLPGGFHSVGGAAGDPRRRALYSRSRSLAARSSGSPSAVSAAATASASADASGPTRASMAARVRPTNSIRSPLGSLRVAAVNTWPRYSRIICSALGCLGERRLMPR